MQRGKGRLLLVLAAAAPLLILFRKFQLNSSSSTDSVAAFVGSTTRLRQPSPTSLVKRNFFFESEEDKQQRIADEEAWKERDYQRRMKLIAKRRQKVEGTYIQTPREKLKIRVKRAFFEKSRRRDLDDDEFALPEERLTVSLEKPLGIKFTDWKDGVTGAVVDDIVEEGSAWANGEILPTDRLTHINGKEVESADFDEIIEEIKGADSPVEMQFYRKPL